jgi:hypothetical protein
MSDAGRAQIWSQVMRERCGADAELVRLARQLPGGRWPFHTSVVGVLRALASGVFPRTIETQRRPA